jgi:hypothetical protein
MPPLTKPYIDIEQGADHDYSRGSDYSLEKDLEHDSIYELDGNSEKAVHDMSFHSGKSLEHETTRSPKFSPSMILAPINQSPIIWPSIRFQSPTVQEVGHLFELSRKNSSRPQKRTRAKTWHTGIDIE